MPKTVLEGYVGITEAAGLLSKTEQTIYNWIKADKLTYLEVGGKPYISLLEIARLKKDGGSETGNPPQTL